LPTSQFNQEQGETMSKQVHVKTKTIRRPQAGRLEILMGNNGVYFELEDDVYVSGFDFCVGQKNAEQRIALLTSIICAVAGVDTNGTIENLEGRDIQVRHRGMQIVAIGQVASAPVHEALSQFVQDGWFDIEKFAETLSQH
jgi:hypothetical protein